MGKDGRGEGEGGVRRTSAANVLDSCYEIVAIAILTQVKPMGKLSLLVCTLLLNHSLD